MVEVVPVVHLVEEVIRCFDRHNLSVSYNKNLLFAIAHNVYSIKARVIQAMVAGVLLVEVVEVPFNSLLVWMLS